MWPALVAPLIAIVLATFAQIVFFVVLTIPQALNGRDPQAAEITDQVGPWSVICMIAVSQLSFAAVAFGAGALSPEGFRRRLGWTRPSIPWWGWAAIPLGACVPGLLGALLSWPVPQFPGEASQIEHLWTSIPLVPSVVYVGFVAVLPGLIEESLFRGYVQRRLLQRWRPPLAIGVASAVFAVAHIDPKTVVFAFPLGIWLGVIAWRFGSVFPGMIAHAFINGSWNAFQILCGHEVIGPRAQISIQILALAAACGAFAATLWMLRQGGVSAERVTTHRG